jgi:hypothetical protein
MTPGDRGLRARLRSPIARVSSLVRAFACAAVVLGAAAAARAAPPPVEVTVIAPEGLRLGDELKRELEISGFAVTVVATPADAAGRGMRPDWNERVRALAAAQAGRTVAVRADERQIVLLSPPSGAAPAAGVQTSLELQLAPEERSARRRACLTVVEYLRVLAESDDRVAVKQASEAKAARDARPPPTPQASLEKSTSASDPAPEESSQPIFHGLPWTMGVGTTLDLSSSGGQPGGHLQFMWYFPFGPRVSLRARVAWPVVGANFETAESDIRMWTFGAAVGLQYAFSEPPQRWRPFVGLALGNLMALSETTAKFTAQTRTAVTPSAILGLEAGLRYVLSTRMQLLGELEVTRGWLGPTASMESPEDERASALALHASLGVLFEY